ncbi:MAG: hypothetical protein FWD61_06710 [Phycisphaerales bacterium]|nr:hypothetical protein [Phycisphaerales bacterium]
MKRLIANTVSSAIALIAGAATVLVSLKYLKEPEGATDWIVLILSGLTTGTIAFFITWGHFQDEPVADSPEKTES